MTSPFKIAVNYGAMNGLGCFAIFILLYLGGMHPLGPAAWIGAWIPPLFIVLATLNFRNSKGGFITYGEAFITGFLTAASGAVLYALLVYIFGTLIDQGLIDSYKEMMLADLEQTEKIIRSTFSDAMYEQGLEQIKNTTLKQTATSEFLQKTMGGFIISLITSAFIKRNPPAVL
jgi:hypothetical protein